MYSPYEILKFWLPVISGFVFAYKAYKGLTKSVGEWAHTLLSNHLTHIQDATMATHKATLETNTLLADSSTKATEVARHVEAVKSTLADHNDKEMLVWSGVVKTLAVLEDRTRPELMPRARLRKKK